MAQSLSTSCPSLSEALSTAPAIQLPDGTLQHSSVPHPAPPFFRNGHLGHVNLDTFSPVNENGSFEFDRVLKTGKVLRRVKHKHVSELPSTPPLCPFR